jgi:hypothetical protein
MSDTKHLSENTNKIQVVGKLRQEIIDLLGLTLVAGYILMYPGAIKHIKCKRPDDFNRYFQRIPDIISKPDYVGVHPTEPNSVEFVKVIDNDVLVAVTLAPEGYLYLSSMYVLTPAKVPKRLKSGRLIAVPKNKP